jgi:hypothetical protein
MAPNGGGTITILGFAVFGVANWHRGNGNSQDIVATQADGTCHPMQKNQVPANKYDCGVVWGYIFSGVYPPDALVNQIGNSNNPFAPLLIALVD